MSERKDWLRIIATDEYSARGDGPTTEHAIRTARNLVGVPLGNGGIQIEIHAGGADVEIEIGPDGKITSVMWEAQP